jgi:hypothetical protein
MPLLPSVNADDEILYAQMLDIATPNTQVLAAPCRSKVKYLAFIFSSAPNATITLTFATRHGTLGQSFVIASGSGSGPGYFLELSQMDRANYMEAGDPFAITSDGAGTNGGFLHVLAVLQRA